MMGRVFPRVLLGLIAVAIGFAGKAWARCEDCPVPFSVLTGSWVIADEGKKVVLIVEPERRPGKSKTVGVHLLEARSCSVIGSGSLAHVRNSSTLALMLRDSSGVLRTAFISVADDDKSMVIQAPCPRSAAECFWSDVTQRTFHRMSAEETLLPYCSAIAN